MGNAFQELHDIRHAEAALMASTVTIMRGAGAPGTAAADWKAVTVEQFAGLIQVSPVEASPDARHCSA